ncbi:MAG: outer membrane beta-barrel protein [Pseudomonadota bacterium]
MGLNLLGGFSSTNHEQTGLGGVESQMGLSFGFGLEFPVLPNVAVEIDILNAQKNFEFTSSLGGLKESYYLTYLETPVLIKWLLSKNFNFKVGPYLSGLMISGVKESGGVSSPVKSEFKNDYGVTFGAWFGFQTKKNLLIGLDLRYDLGMADIRNDNLADSHLYTRTLMALLNFSFLFK